MAYLNNIPNATDMLAVSQSQIKENFAQLETQFIVDHDSLLVAGATGKHRKITLPEYAVAADPVSAVNEGIIYTKNSGTQPELYYREESAGDIIQLTSNGYPFSFIKSFVFINAAGIIQGTAFNVASVTRVGEGTYNIVFTNNLADANYVVTTGYEEAANRSRGVCIRNKVLGGFTVQTVQGNDSPLDLACNLAVLKI